jgi:uncharacterized membrane protein (UPF0127 family)
MAAKQTTLRDDAGQYVCECCVLADTPVKRLVGLLRRDALAPGDGLLIRPSNAIHTWFMRFAIDAVFLDRNLKVVRVAANLKPWRMASASGARAVLELRAGEAMRRGIEAGQQLSLGPETA